MVKKNDINKLLNYNVTKYNLISTSTYLILYELFVKVIIEELKYFYIPIKEDKKGSILEINYNNDVIGLITNEKYNVSENIRKEYKKDIIINSSYWYVRNNALSPIEFVKIILFKKHRNEIAHQIDDILSKKGYEIKIHYINEMRKILLKVKFFWIKTNYDCQFNDSHNIDDSYFMNNAKESIFLFDYYLKIFNDEIYEIETKIKEENIHSIY